jgi:hypothetical protein
MDLLLHLIKGRAKQHFPNLSSVLVLVPIFLIISSSVYPAIISGIQNKEVAIVDEVLAQLGNKGNGNEIVVDTSGYHASIPFSSSRSPSPIQTAAPASITSSPSANQDDDDDKEFTAQAALTLTRASQTNNIVNSKAYYDISFRTTTAGVIKTVEMDFPVGTYVGAATLVEAVGIGPGTIAASGSTGTGMKITYTVTNAVNVPALTKIRIQIANVNNPATPSTSLTVSITTRDSSNAIIDGPSTTKVYNIKQIGADDIADSAVTTPKIAEEVVTTPKIADEAVTFSKLSPDAIPTSSSFIAWQDDTIGNNEILFRRGVVFDPEEKNLSNNAGFSGEPAISIAGNNVYVVWYDDTSGNNEILYKRSTDGGANFGATVNLSNNAGVSDFPAVAASGNNVYVVWEDNTSGNDEILYRRSIDGGANFDPTINLSNNAGLSLFPAVAASGNKVYVVWQDTTLGNIEILYGRSTDGGANFDPTINLSNDAGFSFNPAISASGNNVYAVWQDFTSGDDEILYRRSIDGGANFDPAINLSNDAGVSSFPAVATSGNNVYVVWRDETSGNNEILYKRSTDGGANFDPTINLSNNAEFSFGQVVTASGNNVYVVWSDSAPGPFEILYKRSTDGGANFGPTINLSNTGTGVSFSPAIAYYDTQL